jgi:hypothetical protein
MANPDNIGVGEEVETTHAQGGRDNPHTLARDKGNGKSGQYQCGRGGRDNPHTTTLTSIFVHAGCTP